jgi:hypothetical protein
MWPWTDPPKSLAVNGAIHGIVAKSPRRRPIGYDSFGS